MKPTLKDNGKIFLLNHKIYGLQAAKIEVGNGMVWCWLTGQEAPVGSFEEDIEWLGPAEVKTIHPAPSGASPDNL